jgi:lipopolysaccharide export system permease protein
MVVGLACRKADVTMRTVRKLLYRDILGAVLYVSLAFLALFSFIDFVDELGRSDPNLSTPPVWRAALVTLLRAPAHLYDLTPISLLIGTIYALSRMAQASEFTILRTGGLGPGRALGLLLVPGLLGAALTFATGEWISPVTQRWATEVSKGPQASTRLSQQGVWLKDTWDDPSGERRQAAIRIRAVRADGELDQVLILEFTDDARLTRRIEAASARVDAEGQWTLRQAQTSSWPRAGATLQTERAASPDALTDVRSEQMAWRSSLGADVVRAAVSPMTSMTTTDLWRYSAHLGRQAQSSQRYDIEFWRRVFYPLSCLVMSALALPFAYLHGRAGGVSLKVFGGVMLGISFVLLNNLAGHIGLLNQSTPWLASAWPALLYGLMSLATFGWLVRYR